MENNIKQNLDTTRLLSSIRSVGTLKPAFNIQTQQFSTPQLNVLGTGFWVEKGVFVTCAHVVQSLLSGPLELTGMLVVGGNNDPYLKATISILDIEHDLAVLQVSNKDFHATKIENCLDLNSEKEIVGEDVYFAGYPLGNQLLNESHTPIFAKGVIAHASSSINKIRKEIKISGFVEGGFSGSPVVNNKGDVIGVVASHPEQTKNIFNIISWEHVAKLIELENS